MFTGFRYFHLNPYSGGFEGTIHNVPEFPVWPK